MRLEPGFELVKNAFLDELLLGAVEDFAKLAGDAVHGLYVSFLD